jgi:2-keto-4-pentenoate hydratase
VRHVGAAAAALLEARRTRCWLSCLPEGARPADDADAYAVQDLVAEQLGPVAGWKVGAATPTSEPFRAPLHAATLRMGGERHGLPAGMFHVIGLEAEIVYRLARDLPPRGSPYRRSEVLDAVDSVHPAIEIVDTRFAAFGSADAFSQRADQQNHGALAVGLAQRAWSGIDPRRQPVRLTIDGAVRAEAVGGNSAGDPVRLLAWLADHGARGLGGLRAGEVITTGSCTGTIFVEPGARACAAFPGLGTVHLEVA